MTFFKTPFAKKGFFGTPYNGTVSVPVPVVTPSGTGGGGGGGWPSSIWGESGWRKKIKFLDKQLCPVDVMHNLVAAASKKKTQAPHPLETLPIRRTSPSHVEKDLRRDVKTLRKRILTLEGQATEKRQLIKFMTASFEQQIAAADVKSAAAEHRISVLEAQIGDLEQQLRRPVFTLSQAAPWYMAGGVLGIASFFLKDALRLCGVFGAVTCAVIGTIEGFQKRD